MNLETAIMRNVRLSINKTYRARLIRNNVGFASKEKVQYGLGTGSADLIGVLPNGSAIAIEIKTPRGRLRPDQKAWWRSALKWNVLGGVANSVEEAFALLELAERGLPGITLADLQ